MDIEMKTATASCLDCGRTIDLGPQPRDGQQFTCSHCGTQLEIINLQPLELDWAFSEFELDWAPDEEVWD